MSVSAHLKKIKKACKEIEKDLGNYVKLLDEAIEVMASPQKITFEEQKTVLQRLRTLRRHICVPGEDVKKSPSLLSPSFSTSYCKTNPESSEEETGVTPTKASSSPVVYGVRGKSVKRRLYVTTPTKEDQTPKKRNKGLRPSAIKAEAEDEAEVDLLPVFPKNLPAASASYVKEGVVGKVVKTLVTPKKGDRPKDPSRLRTPLKKLLLEDSEPYFLKEKKVPTIRTASPLPRDKASRKKLCGNTCLDCRDFYAGISDPMLKEELLQKCSKHRSKYPQPKESPGKVCWELELRPDNTQDLPIKENPLRRRDRKKRTLL